jgi:hypothetical protein
MVPIVAGVPFGTGMVLIAISIIGYILDTYTIYAASAMAGTVVARSVRWSFRACTVTLADYLSRTDFGCDVPYLHPPHVS